MAFISEIAKYINKNYDLSKESLTIIFPNKRAAMMLRQELMSNDYEKNIWLPQIISIQEAMSSWSGLQLLDNIDIIFELIRIINKSGNILSNDLYGLASQMLKDFDEIDQYAVDAKKLFQLTKEAKELELWTPDESNLLESKYLDFFSSLIYYYETLRNTLSEASSGYYGMISRKIYEYSDNELQELIGDKKIIFAGFNALTKTEENIIIRLVKSKNATLLWDLDEYYFKDEKQEAGIFARDFFERNKHIEALKPTFLGKKLSEGSKKINIIGASGAAIQTNALQLELNKENTTEKNEVIVLSDESLLIPVLNSIPNKFNNLQVTMGFPYSKTILNQFLQHLFIFQKNIKPNEKGIYFWSLSRLLNTELIKIIFSSQDLQLLFNWQNRHIRKSTYYIDTNDFEELKQNHNIYDFISLISSKWNNTSDCINSVKELLKNIYKKVKDSDNTNFIRNQISIAGKIVNKIDKLMTKYEQLIQIADIEMLYKQSSAEMTISLKGSKDGLQIMGLLETRNLDFNTVHILSVNEGILPQSKNANSLIPFDLRKFYQLPIYSNKQAVYAYHFYRLLQNAENVNIYYNTLADGMGEGEPSRFIRQIIHEMPNKNRNIAITEKTYKSPTTNTNNIKKLEASKKDDIVYEKIIKKLSGINDGKKSGLSPTSISCYNSCHLKFYLQYIEKKQDKTPNELIQSNVLGSVIHATLENLYRHFEDKIIDINLYNEIRQKFYEESYKKALADNNFPNGLPNSGFNYLNSQMVDTMLNNFINSEIKFLSDGNTFKILGLEQELSYSFYIPQYDINVNLIGNADRIDLIGNKVRIIDYKTGAIKDSDVVIKKGAKELEKISDKSLQLLIYKYLYKKNNPNIDCENIEAGIFGLRKINKGIFSLSNKSDYFNDNELITNCESGFINIFSEILDRDKPFTQTEDENNCKNCDFKEICKRNVSVF